MPRGIYERTEKHLILLKKARVKAKQVLSNMEHTWGDKISEALTGKFLSEEHKRKLRGKRVGFTPPNKLLRKIIVCKFCGKGLGVPESSTRKYCSPDCVNKGRTGRKDPERDRSKTICFCWLFCYFYLGR